MQMSCHPENKIKCSRKKWESNPNSQSDQFSPPRDAGESNRPLSHMTQPPERKDKKKKEGNEPDKTDYAF